MRITYYLGVSHQVVMLSPRDGLCKNCNYFPPLTVGAVPLAVSVSNFYIIWMLFPLNPSTYWSLDKILNFSTALFSSTLMLMDSHQRIALLARCQTWTILQNCPPMQSCSLFAPSAFKPISLTYFSPCMYETSYCRSCSQPGPVNTVIL